MSETLPDKESVLREKADHPAVRAIVAWNAEALTEARWDRNELTLTIAREGIVAAARTVQQAGYNFLEDVTAVDWFPAVPRFQISYHPGEASSNDDDEPEDELEEDDQEVGRE